jgi:hypothetical protein
MRHQLAVVALFAAGCVCAAFVVGCGGGGGGQPFTLAGTVTDGAGAPVSAALVTATVAGQTQPVDSTTTSATGVFAFALPPAIYIVEASKDGLVAQQTVTITASQPNLSVSLVLVEQPPPPPENLGGRVINATTSAPIVGATVTATIQGQSTPVKTTTTNSDGRYGFVLTTDQTYVITVTATGFISEQLTVPLPLGGSELAVDFALAPS